MLQNVGIMHKDSAHKAGFGKAGCGSYSVHFFWFAKFFCIVGIQLVHILVNHFPTKKYYFAHFCLINEK